MKAALNIDSIKSLAPNSWEAFLAFYNELKQPHAKLSQVTPEDLPLEMLLGILMNFFRENGMELDVSNVEFNDLPDMVLDAFDQHEKISKHYS